MERKGSHTNPVVWTEIVGWIQERKRSPQRHREQISDNFKKQRGFKGISK